MCLSKIVTSVLAPFIGVVLLLCSLAAFSQSPKMPIGEEALLKDIQNKMGPVVERSAAMELYEMIEPDFDRLAKAQKRAISSRYANGYQPGLYC